MTRLLRYLFYCKNIKKSDIKNTRNLNIFNNFAKTVTANRTVMILKDILLRLLVFAKLFDKPMNRTTLVSALSWQKRNAKRKERTDIVT